MKADLLDRRARIYFNLFRYEVKDQQLTAVGGANNANAAAERQETVGQGVELDFEAYITPQLLVTLGASYNDTEINDDDILVGICFACTVTDPIVLVAHRPDDVDFRRDRRQPAAAGARDGSRTSRCATACRSATASCSPTPTGPIAAK